MRCRDIASAVAMLLVATAINAEEASTGPHIIHAKLKPAAWAARFVTTAGRDHRVKVEQRIPITLVYDAAGRQLVGKTGYGGGGESWLKSVLGNKAPASAPLLSELVRDLTTPDGNAFPPVFPNGEPVVVIFGAAWCGPCRALKSDLGKVSGITILDLDVDQAKMNWPQVMEAVQKTAPH